MEHIDRMKEAFPEVAKDIKINISNVLGQSALTPEQIWGTAIATALYTKNRRLAEAVLAEAQEQGVSDGVREDARAAAVLMAMNNVYYRFRHIIENEEYSQKPARLRMQRINQVTSNKADFELFCLAVSAIGNCQMCLKSHEKVVTEHGISTDQVHDAVRIAATMNAAAMALDLDA